MKKAHAEVTKQNQKTCDTEVREKENAEKQANAAGKPLIGINAWPLWSKDHTTCVQLNKQLTNSVTCGHALHFERQRERGGF